MQRHERCQDAGCLNRVITMSRSRWAKDFGTGEFDSLFSGKGCFECRQSSEIFEPIVTVPAKLKTA